jgi:hypothetical protein
MTNIFNNKTLILIGPDYREADIFNPFLDKRNTLINFCGSYFKMYSEK